MAINSSDGWVNKKKTRQNWQLGEHNNTHVIDEKKKSINIRVEEEFLELDKF